MVEIAADSDGDKSLVDIDVEVGIVIVYDDLVITEDDAGEGVVDVDDGVIVALTDDVDEVLGDLLISARDAPRNVTMTLRLVVFGYVRGDGVFDLDFGRRRRRRFEEGIRVGNERRRSGGAGRGVLKRSGLNGSRDGSRRLV
jgi:hypothetical protein